MEKSKEVIKLVWHDLGLLKLCCIVFSFLFVSRFRFTLLQVFFKAFVILVKGYTVGDPQDILPSLLIWVLSTFALLYDCDYPQMNILI